MGRARQPYSVEGTHPEKYEGEDIVKKSWFLAFARRKRLRSLARLRKKCDAIWHGSEKA